MLGFSRRFSGMKSSDLNFDEHGVPYSKRFGDVYFCREDELAESRHVFLNGSAIKSQISRDRDLYLGELGFGTGLNFLLTWQLWGEQHNAGQWLHYVGIEGFPIEKADLKQIHHRWPELERCSSELRAALPEPCSGIHRLKFKRHHISLTLIYLPVSSALKAMSKQMDVWYLDGFAPRKNPEMWSSEVIARIAQLSRPGTTLATYSVAGVVRRGLMATRFNVARAPGFGEKREMIVAAIPGDLADIRGHDKQWEDGIVASKAPWFRHEAGAPTSSALVIGAGIAGAAVAHALTARGVDVTVAESERSPALHGSGNPRGIVSPALTADKTAMSQFYFAAYRYTLNLLERARAAGVPGEDCGILRILATQLQRDRYLKALSSNDIPADEISLLDPHEVIKTSGLSLPSSGALWFRRSGWVAPRQLIKWLLTGSRLKTDTTVTQLTRCKANWHAFDASGEKVADTQTVILTNAAGALNFAQARHLPLMLRKGQTTEFQTTGHLAGLRTVLVGDCYLLPPLHDQFLTGATFDPVEIESQPAPLTPTDADHERNLNVLRREFSNTACVTTGGHAGFRAVTPDHLPIAGPLVEKDEFARLYQDIRHGSRHRRFPEPPELPGLYALLGLGTRGMCTAPLLGHYLATLILNEPSPLSEAVAHALHPSRFLVRKLRRGG